MTSTDQEEGDLSKELRQLGSNLTTTLKSAWESEDRKKVQQEIETGLLGLGEELRKAGDEIDVEGIGQEVRAGVEDASQKIQSAEVGDRVRNELLSVLQTINTQLQDVQTKWTPPEGQEDAEAEEKSEL